MSVDHRTVKERFWAKVKKTDTCWLWTGAPSANGYGRIKTGGVMEYAHRLSLDIAGQELVKGMEVDHLCRNRMCVNPDHLEQVTHQENVLRGEAPSAHLARRTHCSKGHPYDGDNLYNRPDGARICRDCARAASLAWYHRRKLILCP